MSKRLDPSTGVDMGLMGNSNSRMMHTGKGRAKPLHIEYIHIGMVLSIIQDTMTEAILSHPRLHLPRKIALVKAIGKVMWIQNDLFAKWYTRDGDEFADEKDTRPIEQEGYIHGKKVVDDVDLSDPTGYR